MIRVMVVEDSRLVQELVVQALQSDPEVVVVGVVSDGTKAVESACVLKPDVITMDIELPGISGLEATRQIMKVRPTPIIVLTSLSNRNEAAVAFQALAHGALVVLEKPESYLGPAGEAFTQNLLQHVKTCRVVRMNVDALRRPKARQPSPPPPPQPAAPQPPARPSGEPRSPPRMPSLRRFDVVGIGASAGGPVCVVGLLNLLPKEFDVPVVLVQHIARGFIHGFLEWLSGQTGRPARIAVEGETPKAGIVYSSRDDAHLGFDASGAFRYSDAPPMRGHRPAVDALFSSMAQVFRSRVVGILLTGMGADGADGLKRVREAGGVTFAQDEASSLVFGMPHEALKRGAVDRVHSLEGIAQALLALGTPERKLVP